jgi:hypothetical protein
VFDQCNASSAEAASAANADKNNLKGKVCAIFAKSSASFRASQDKARTLSLFL